jgi:hypothetical protein
MKIRLVHGVLALSVVLLAGGDPSDALRSGPQVGERLPGTFDVQNCNGPDAGDTNCLV